MAKGYLYIIAAAILWGVIGPVSRLAFDQGVAPLEVAFWRAVLAWICFGSHAIITRQIWIQKRDVPALLIFSVMGVTLFYGSYQLAVDKGGAALAAVLLYTAPAWVTVLSRIIFREPLTVAKCAALAFFSTYLAYYLYYLGLRTLEASRAAITATIEPVVAALVAYFWWQETFSVIGYAGGALILASVVLIIWDGSR